MDDPKVCAVLTPVFNTPERKTEDRLLELSRRGYAVRYLIGCSDIVLARSIMASDALAAGFAETLWVDADIVFDPDDVDKLRAHGRPYTCGMYCRKGLAQFAGTFFESPEEIAFGPGGGLTAVKYAGLGFTHVRAGVYEAVRRLRDLPECARGHDGRSFTPYFLPTVVRDGAAWDYLPEDSAFCHYVRKAGFEVLADTTIRLAHIGKYEWGWDDFVARPPTGAMNLRVGGAAPADATTGTSGP